MKLLIDYENVSLHGLQGHELLDERDELYFYCCKECQSIPAGLLAALEERCKKVTVYSRYSNRKNEVDGYIISMAGYLFGQGYDGEIGIISADKGYKAAEIFWMRISEEKRTLLLGKDVADVLAASLTDKERARYAKEYYRTVNLTEEVKKGTADGEELEISEPIIVVQDNSFGKDVRTSGHYKGLRSWLHRVTA